MSRLRGLLVALLVSAIGSLPAPVVAAESCKLTPVAALPLLRSVTNLPIVPAHIDDQWSWLIIDTGAIRSLIFSHAADALNLPRRDLRNALDNVASLGGPPPAQVVRRGRGSFSGVPMTAPELAAWARTSSWNLTSILDPDTEKFGFAIPTVT